MARAIDAIAGIVAAVVVTDQIRRVVSNPDAVQAGISRIRHRVAELDQERNDTK